MDTKYPEIEVQLTGEDGNAFGVMGSVARALQQAGVDEEDIATFHDEAMSGDYNNLLQTCMRWVSVL